MTISRFSIATFVWAIASSTANAGDAHVESPASVIGSAKLLSNGTIILRLRAEDGAEGYFEIKPNDPAYSETLAHVGELKPGQEKLIPPWPDKKVSR
jgi:hypothetical protein